MWCAQAAGVAQSVTELARRHQKFEDTPYSLEPNIKESPGGLRDLQVFLWCAQAAGVAQSVTDMKTAGLITEREMHTLMACARHSPGGLRDLQVFLWCAQAAGVAQSVTDMKTAGLITEREMHTLMACARHLETLRISLHLITRRAENRLLFDVQEELAQSLGYTATQQLRPSEALMKRYYLNAKAVVITRRAENRLLFDVQEELAQSLGYTATQQLRPSEALMKRYYLNAKAVVQMSVIQLQALADRLFGSYDKVKPVALERAFVARGDEMDIVHDEVFEEDPNAILRLFYVYHSHPELTRLSTRLLRALWHASPNIDEDYRHNPIHQQTFLDILRMPKGTYHSLKLMNMWDVLGRFLPPFRQIVGQMQHDLYHIFTVDQHTLRVVRNIRRFARSEFAHEYPFCATVDQHTLRVVRNIRRFARSEFAHEYPFCAQIMSELPDNWRLTLAGLYHDIGKGLGGQHSEIGAEKVTHFCQTFGLNQATTDFVSFLVREHLTMSQTAQKKDISDPDVFLPNLWAQPSHD